MLGEDRRGRSIVGADVLEHRGVARLLGVVIDDEVDLVDHAAEIVRLHVDHRDPIVLLHRVGGQRLDVDVEQVRHPQILGPGDPLHRADDRRRLRAPQDVSEREAARHGVRIGIVVEHDQDALAVAEVALVLLHARPGHGARELGEQRPAEELGHREIRDVRKFAAQLVGAVGGRGRPDAEHVDERAAGIADRFQDLLQAAAAAVFDDDAGAWAEIGFEVGVGAPGIAGRDVDVGVVEAPRRRTAFDDELDLEAGHQDLVEHPDDEFILADG